VAASLALSVHFNSSLLVVTDSLLKEVSFALEADHVHPFEGVINAVVLGDAKCEEETVCDELDVLGHKR